MKIKICGLTSSKDLLLADSLGADFAGFIQYARSPRYVPVNRLQEMLSTFSGKAAPVLVFVNETLENILSLIQRLPVKTVQLHGEETPQTVNHLKSKGLRVIKAIPIKNSSSFEPSARYNPDHFLLDTHHPKKKGGTGQAFDWSLLKNQGTLVKKSFVAGGLTPDSVPLLLNQCEPWGLDVSSGVESTPGQKDPQKMRDFFDQVKGFYAKSN